MKTIHPPRVAFAIVLAFLTVSAFLPVRARADEAPKAIKSTGKCMMWKVSSKTATVYLLGSMHMAMPEVYPLPREIEQAFAKSDTLVVEVNINKIDQQKMVELVQNKGMYGGNETLSGSIKKETWEAVKDACNTVGLPPTGIDKMKPWVVGITIQMLQIQKLGLDPALGIDKHFLDLADQKGKTIDELETADFQVSLLASFDPKMQEATLAQILAETKDLKSDMAKLTSAWIAGDARAVDQQITAKQKEHPEFAEVAKKLIYDRNGPMAAKIESYLKGSKIVFVVVGSAHVVGDKGIVKILQNDKFKVEQSSATKAMQPSK